MLLAAVSSSVAVATATVPVRRGNVVGIGAPYTTTGTGVVAAAAAAWDNQRCSSSSGASKVQSSLAAFRSSSRRSAAVQSPVSRLLFSSRLGGEMRMGVTKKSLGGVALQTHKRLSSSIRAQAAGLSLVPLWFRGENHKNVFLVLVRWVGRTFYWQVLVMGSGFWGFWISGVSFLFFPSRSEICLCCWGTCRWGGGGGIGGHKTGSDFFFFFFLWRHCATSCRCCLSRSYSVWLPSWVCPHSPSQKQKTPMSTLSLTETPTYPICINNNNLSMKSSLAPLRCHSFILRSETHVSFSCFHAPIHHSEP